MACAIWNIDEVAVAFELVGGLALLVGLPKVPKLLVGIGGQPSFPRVGTKIQTFEAPAFRDIIFQCIARPQDLHHRHSAC